MFKNKYKSVAFVLLCLIVVFILNSIPFSLILNFEDNMLVTQAEINELTKRYSNFIVSNEIYQVKANDIEKENKLNQYAVKFKLFNLINIKNLKVNQSLDNEIYVGGNCIGISLKSNGVIVVGSNFIITKEGNVSPFNESGLQVGDTITHINENEINSMSDISKILDDYKKGNKLKLSVVRNGQNIELFATPALDIQTGKYKLGIWIRDDALGIGTMTFIDKDNNRYGALGHAIIDADTGSMFKVRDGEIYNCNVVGVKKGEKGRAGELLGLFLQGENNKLGNVDKNVDTGIYGFINNNDFLEARKLYEIGGRLTAKPGKAKILSCINGTEVKEYDIEIIKTNYQSKPNEKSMVIKITDNDLIEKTGGIVQGMSGSPIIQNGKIVGAVTHVFINDPTKGFGLYLDWMIIE